MAKIRGLKPELWTDENFVELSPYARLLWMGLWNYACDNGHVQDKSKQIKMRVLPTDDVNCADLLREIEGQQLIERADGWITIPNLSHHQKPHRRWWKTCDKPGCELPEGAFHAPSNRGTTVAPPKRNRVATADGDVVVDGDGDGENKPLTDKSAESVKLDRFDEFWDTYGKKEGRKVSVAEWKRAIKRADPERIITAARAYAADRERQYRKDPVRWLKGDHWNDEPMPRHLRVATRQQETNDLFDRALARAQAADQAEQGLPAIGGDQ